MADKYEIRQVSLRNGETLGYRQCGTSGPVLVLLHGNMTSSKHLEILMQQLEASYQLYAVDLRGFGASTYKQRINSLKDLADDLLLWAEAVGLTGFALAGWSTGGGVAMQFAADHPHYVEKLILIESVGIKGYRLAKEGSPSDPSRGLGRLKSKVAQWGLGKMKNLNVYANRKIVRTIWDKTIYTRNHPAPDLYEEYIEDAMAQRNVADLNYALLNFNISHGHNGLTAGTGVIDQIKAPTLVLQGDRDLVVPLHIGQEIAAALGEKATLVILKDCGHSPFIDCLQETVAQISQFM